MAKAGHEAALLLVDGIVHGVAVAGVEDLDTEDLHGGRGTVLLAAGQGDVEGQDPVVVPGVSQLVGRIQVALDGVEPVCDAPFVLFLGRIGSFEPIFYDPSKPDGQ